MKRNPVALFFFALLVVSMLVMGIVASASAQGVSQVQSAIKTSGAFWVAAENPISRLTPQQQQHLLGVVHPPRHTTSAAPTCEPQAVGLPPSLDWRNNGGNYVTPVKDQGSCGSCWAFSAISTLESATLIYNQTPNTNLDLSEQVLVSCCSSTCSPNGDCGGGYPSKAADFLRDTGAPLDTCLPYSGYGSCGSACANWQKTAHKIKSWNWVVNFDQSEQPTVDKIRAGLQHGPLVITMAVYGDFFYYAGGVYRQIYGALSGYHAIMVVGYDDAGQYFIVKNSWGTSWGEQGFFRIAYSEVTGKSQFGYMTLAYNIAPTCDYSPAEYFTASGGIGNLQVATDPGSSWSATSNASWITIASGSSGTGSGPIAYVVAPNPTASRRTGTMTVPGGTFTVLQELGPSQCTYALSPTSSTQTSAGGTGSVTVTAGSGCVWAAASNASWITVVGQALGTGNGTVTYSVAANDSTTARSGTITIGGQTLTVNQAAASCTYALSSANASFNAGSGTGSVSVTTPTGCYWQAASYASWLTITSGYYGSANGAIAYSVAANPAGSPRTGTMTIAGQTFTVTQAAAPCTYALSSTNASITTQGGSSYVSVTATLGCSWTAASSAEWITTPWGNSGSGSGNVWYSVAANTSAAARIGTLTIGGQTLTVTEAAAPCTYAISPTYTTLIATSGTGSVSVTTPTGCSWTAASNTPWLTVTSGASGSGTGTVAYSVAANTVASQRSGTMTIAGQTSSVTQTAAPCTYALSSNNASFNAGSGTGSVSVTTPTGCYWQAGSSVSWLTITSAYYGSANATVTYSIAANPAGSPRTGTMAIGGQTFTVTQEAAPCTYALSSTNASLGTQGGSGYVSVTAPTGCTWTAASSTAWITTPWGNSGSGSGNVWYSVAANTMASERTGTLTIGGQTFTVTEAAAPCTYAISPTYTTLNAASGTGSVSVTAPTGCTWTAAGNAAWLTISSGASGSGNGTVAYSVAANTVASQRSGTMTIAGQTSSVTQAAAPCTYALSSTNASFNARSGTSSVGVTTPTGCYWQAGSSVSWLTITSAYSGSANATVTYSIAANPAGSPRTGTLIIGGQTFTVTQEAAPCTYALSSTNASLGTQGGSGYVSVTAPTGCTWTAASSTAWLTTPWGNNGSGSGNVWYSVAANSIASQRTGTFTIGGQTLTITQAAAPCTYAISPTYTTLNAASGTGSVSVTAPTGCTWTAAGNAAWLTISSGASGSGSGTVAYSVAANTVASQRSGTMTIAGQTSTVYQAAAPCTYALSSNSASFNAGSGTGTVSVTATSGCTWTAVSYTSWLTITSGYYGSANGTVSYSVAANPAGSPRTGTMTIAGQTFTVTQAGAPCTYAMSSNNASLGVQGGSGYVSVTATPGCSWTAASSTAWITTPWGNSGSGNGTAWYSVAANTIASQRTGTFTIGGQTLTVTQAAAPCIYAISPTYNTLNAASGSGSVSITAPTGCTWTAAGNAAWLTITSGASGSGNGTVAYTVAANTVASQRSGTMTIAGQTSTVYQAAAPCTYALSSNSASFTAGSGAGSVSVITPTGCNWTAVSYTSWLTITSGYYGSNGTVSYSVAANPAGSPRTGTMTIAGQTFTVTQAGAPCTYAISSTSASLGTQGGSGYVSVTAPTGCTWTAAGNAAWLTTPWGNSGSGNGNLWYSVAANPLGLQRTGTLTVGGQTLTITQAAAPCTYAISPTYTTLNATSGTGSVSVTAPTGCSWTAASNTPWLTVSSGASGSGSGTLAYSVAANTVASQRSGTMTIAGQIFTLYQSGSSKVLPP